MQEEKVRLSALRRLGILDTPTEEQYDNIAELASYICKTPIAMINLVDENRQWTKSKIGLDICNLPRKESFCSIIIKEEETVVEISDARKDIRFKDNPWTKDPNTPVVFYAACILREPDGEPIGTLCVVDHKPRKLTKIQKEALQKLGSQVEKLFDLRVKNIELRRSKADLRRQNGLLKNFAGAVSHDLKMPLSNIIMTIDVLKGRYASSLDAKAIDYLDRLKQSSFGMSKYISNILEYYETENISSEDYSEEPFGFVGFIEGIIEMLNLRRECKVSVSKKDFDLVCNRSALEQVFLNLLGNSVKYNDKDHPEIEITGKENRDFYYFSVKDNGMGIPKEMQTKIFDLFSIASERDRFGQKGGGIGLSTVQKIVQKLGGEIEVDSEVGHYTTFNFSIRKQIPHKQKTA